MLIGRFFNRNNLLIISLLFFCGTHGYAKELQTIKIALLDTFYTEIPTLVPESSVYERAYFAGVDAANYAAKKYGYKIEYKGFLYENGALNILSELSKIEKWSADLIMGPGSSDQCLLMNYRMPRPMVISSTASDIHLKSLPSNFYSTFPSDDSIMELLSGFIRNYFPSKNVYIIEQVDCKQCVDAGNLFSASYNKNSLTTKVVEKKIIINNDINSIDVKKLIDGHEDDVILILNSAYSCYISLISHISASFPKKHLVFFSDQDNWSNEVDGNTHTFDLPFESYRIGPILFDKQSPFLKKFKEAYFLIYHEEAKDAISYVTFYSIMSVLEALNEFPDPDQKHNMQEKILYSYHQAVEKHSNWFKTQGFGVYKLTSSGEVLVERFKT